MDYIKDIFTCVCKNNFNEIVMVSSTYNQISYKQLYNETIKLSDLLIKNQMNNSNHIGLFLDNSPEIVISYFAIQMIQAVGVLIPSMYKTWDLSNIIISCDVDFIITDITHFPIVNKLYNFKKENIIYLSKNIIGLYINNNEKIYEKEKPAVIIPTSGSLGKSKSVMLSHKNLISNTFSFIERSELSKRDASLVVLQLSSSFAHMSQLLATIFIGGKLLFCDKYFISKIFWNVVNMKQPTITCMIPSLLLNILNNNQEIVKQKYLNKIIVSGEPIPYGLTVQCIKKIPDINIIKAYGLTEASPRVSQFYLKDIKFNKTSVGKPLRDVNIKIVDDKNKICKAGTYGEILIKGPNIMLGYYKNSNLTKDILSDGWLKSGDIGMIDDDGFLFILGRKKNIIIKNGMKVYPEEIESYLCSLPFIQRALVLLNKSAGNTEKVIAKIVSSKKLKITDIMEKCRNSLASYKIPDEIIITNSLNETINGKIKRV